MIVEQLFIATAAISAVTVLLNVIGASVYDLREVKKQRRFKLHPHAQQHRQRPLVSIIVTTHNDAGTIERCLRSLTSSSYRKLEILIIDSASQDDTKQRIKEFQLAHPKKSIRLVARRSAKTELGIITANLKKYTQGDLILQLDAANILNKQAISTAVKHFNMEPNVDSLTYNRRIISAYSTVGLFQKYPELLRSRSKKAASVFGGGYSGLGEDAIYRRSMLLAPRKPGRSAANERDKQQPSEARGRSHYASDVIVYAAPFRSFYGLMRHYYGRQLSKVATLRQAVRSAARAGGYGGLVAWLRLLAALCTGLVALSVPLLLSYFVYMAIGLHEPDLLFVSGGLLSIVLVAAIWGEEQLALRQKVGYILGIPTTYGLFYLVSLVSLGTACGAIVYQGTSLLRKRLATP